MSCLGFEHDAGSTELWRPPLWLWFCNASLVTRFTILFAIMIYFKSQATVETRRAIVAQFDQIWQTFVFMEDF